MPRIVKVDENGVAAELGFEQGDEILGFDGHPYEDVLDYVFYDGAEKFTINARTKVASDFFFCRYTPPPTVQETKRTARILPRLQSALSTTTR